MTREASGLKHSVWRLLSNSRIACLIGKRVSVPTQAVKPFRVAIAHCVLVFFGEPAVFVELFELRLAGLVVDFVREVRREDERLVADHADSEGQGQLAAFEA